MKRLGIVGCVLGLASIAGCGSAGSEGTKASEDEVISTSCSSLSLEALRPGAREFLLAQGLGSANEEGVIIPDLMATRWTALKIIEPLVENRGSTCLVVMNLATVTKTQDGDAVEPTMEFEVIAVDKATKAFERFEKSIAVPERLQAAYGPARVMMSDGGWQVETSFYYVELTGSSKVLDTWKAVAAGIEISGFAAHLSAKNVKHEGDSPTGEPDGKAEFDPTPNRTWKVKDPLYSLRRGMTAEVLDVYADQLDLDFEEYFSGSGGEVAPWDSPVRRWKLPTESTWHDTPLPPPRN